MEAPAVEPEAGAVERLPAAERARRRTKEAANIGDVWREWDKAWQRNSRLRRKYGLKGKRGRRG